MGEYQMIAELRPRLRYPVWLRRTWDLIRDNLPAFLLGELVGASVATAVLVTFFLFAVLGAK